MIQESLSQRLVDYYAGIMQVFYAVCSNEMTLLLQRAAQAFIRDEYSRLSAVTTILATWQDG